MPAASALISSALRNRAGWSDISCRQWPSAPLNVPVAAQISCGDLPALSICRAFDAAEAFHAVDLGPMNMKAGRAGAKALPSAPSPVSMASLI